MSPTLMRSAGWVLSGLLPAFLLFSASGKLTELMPREQKEEMFAHLGWTEDTMKVIGVIEVVITVLFLIPRSGFIGAILLTGYLGGAIAAHVRLGDPPAMQIGVAIMVWVAYGLRNPVVFRLALGADPGPKVT